MRAERRRKQKEAMKLQQQFTNLNPVQQIVVRRTVEMALQDNVEYIIEKMSQAMRANKISAKRVDKILEDFKTDNKIYKEI